MIKTIDKIENGTLDVSEFNKEQQNYIKALVKLSYNEGLEQGQTLPIDSVIESVEFNADEIIAFLNDCETLDEAKMFADEHLR